MQTALLPHLIWKDLRHVRLLFGLWLFLLLAQGTLIGSGFSVGSGSMFWQFAYSVLAIGIPMLQGLVAAILLPILIQDEALVGTTAFWFTRPIARTTVLASKTIFAVGFLIIPPLVVEVLVFAANGIGSRDILRALPEVFYGSLSLIIPVAALAVLTRSFAKFALWALLAWVTLMVIGVLMQFGRMILSPDTIFTDAQNMSLTMSRAIAAGLWGIAGGVVVIVNQYLTRRTRASLIILLIALIVSTGIQSLWTYDFLKRPAAPASAATFPAGTVIPALKPKTTFSNDAIQFSPLAHEKRTDIRVDLLFSEVPAGYQMALSSASSELTFSDGTKIASNKITPLPDMQNSWWPNAVSHAIGDIPVMNARSNGNEAYAQIFNLDTPIFQQRKSEPATLSVNLALKASRVEVTGHLPLQEGARFGDGSRHLEIAEVIKQSQGCRLILRERKVNLWSSGSFQQFNPLENRGGGYLLVNRARHEAIFPEEDNSFDMASTMLQATSRLINRSFRLDFTGILNDKEVVHVDADWLAGAELVLVEAKPAGTLERKLTVTNFLMSPKP